MSSKTDRMVPLGVLLKRESTIEKIENPDISHGQANQSKKGEDFTLLKTECQRVPDDGATTFSVFGLFDGHNGSAAAIYSKENLLNNILAAIPSDLSRDDWLAALPRALVAGFVKTDKDLKDKGQPSGTTVTFVIIDGWVVTAASVGDSRCIFESAEGAIYNLSADHRLEANEEERDRITASGGEVGRLNTGGGAELSTAGGRLIISSDGVWDALSSEVALSCCRGMPPDAAAAQVVKEAVQLKGLRDDTTCIVVDIVPPEKMAPPAPPPKKAGKGVFKSMFRRKSSESSSQPEDFPEPPDLVEEMFEEGSAVLAERLDTEYPLCNMFKLFMCAVCQVEMKPGEGISVHAGSSLPGRLRPWDGPFLCASCQAKKEAMEGKRPLGDGVRHSTGSE
ncbi:probable protein phosphatase 2C 12 isoform X2 [Magnolia sinica]|uniref:probable protein phosphatase 2C 12 isoform X2 n=1 Tax=Magnolia sinica TaxID=86752 RepID=UPI002659D4B7|nr:probable protein phosphatase 2C 12 isoform X2 [Magnolia sinica]